MIKKRVDSFKSASKARANNLLLKFSSNKLSRNLIIHGRCKHIDVMFHLLRDLTKDEVIGLKHCITYDQLANIFTKSLKLGSFVKINDGLGMETLTSVS